MHRDLIRSEVLSIFEKVKQYREHLHQYPELSYQEANTMAFIAKQLDSIGVPYQKEVASTGIIALISGVHHSKNASCIGLRADIDALPILEQNEVPYKSKNEGVMHACGHDVHTSILLGAAEILWKNRNDLTTPIKLIFQPGEEKNPGGASLMIADGCMENPKIDKMYALHVFPDLEVGNVGFRKGLYMASCDEIYVTITGKGGHGALPHQTVDSILVGAEIVTSLQQIVSRQCDPKIPCVLSFGHFEALGTTNVIPEKAILKGTFRTMNEEWREEALKRIQKQAAYIAQAHGATIDIEISKGYPCLVNDEQLTEELMNKAKQLLGNEKVYELPIRLTSEDFAFYSQIAPTCFFRIGVRNESIGIIHGVHHPKFDIDNEALKIGMEMLILSCIK